jgi:hypothetical protein
METNKLRNHKKKIIYTLLAIVFLGFMFGWFSNIRYTIEKRFGDPSSFLYGVTIGVRYDDGLPGYDEEILLDDNDHPVIDFSNHLKKAKEYNANVDVFVYGSFVNSNDPLVVLLNNKVIYNGHPSREVSNFYDEYYINKYFVVELIDFIDIGENTLIISTGNTTESYTINTH